MLLPRVVGRSLMQQAPPMMRWEKPKCMGEVRDSAPKYCRFNSVDSGVHPGRAGLACNEKRRVGTLTRFVPHALPCPLLCVQVPAKRSGHSFTVVESTGYLFGGVPQARPPGPTNEMFKLDMSNRESRVSQGSTAGSLLSALAHARVSTELAVLFLSSASRSVRRGAHASQGNVRSNVDSRRKTWKGCKFHRP